MFGLLLHRAIGAYLGLEVRTYEVDYLAPQVSRFAVPALLHI